MTSYLNIMYLWRVAEIIISDSVTDSDKMSVYSNSEENNEAWRQQENVKINWNIHAGCNITYI